MFRRIGSTLSSLAKNWGMTQKAFPALPFEVAGFFIAGAVVIGVPIYLLLGPVTGIIAAIPAGLLAGTFWFSRRAMKAAYKQIEGQPGAAGAVVGSLRGGWIVTPGVAVTKQQDLITRVVGKPGVILIGEGSPSRVESLLATERKKTARWLPETPIYDMQVGIEAGQIPLMKLQRELNKLPRNLRGGEITEVRKRLDALGGAAGALPIPKGPMPTSARSVRRPR